MLAVVASSLTLTAQTTPPQAARTYTTPRQAELTEQFQDFLSIPNIAADPAAQTDDVELIHFEPPPARAAPAMTPAASAR